MSLSVAVIVAATHCGLKLWILGEFSARFRKEVRRKRRGEESGVKYQFFEGDLLCVVK